MKHYFKSSEIVAIVVQKLICNFVTMKKQDEEFLESLIVGGIIGAALAAIISANKTAGALAGAAIMASLRANENAKKTQLPVLIEENNILYEVNAQGEKKKVKELPKPQKDIPEHFTLK